MSKTMQTLILALLVAVLGGTPAFGITVELPASKDNTIYELVPGTTPRSNALGQRMFAGASGIGDLRRAMVAFDLTAIPPGSTIRSATLTLYNTAPRTPAVSVDLHRVLADWGEGTSDATGTDGRGADATPGDATWQHRFFPGTSWNDDGGDYAGVPSATQSIATMGYFSWSGPGVVADVQAWVDGSAGACGWVLIGAESTLGSMKWFSTRENTVAEQRPVLTVEYDSAVPTQQKTWGGIKGLYQ
jgi:hypothetical protein